MREYLINIDNIENKKNFNKNNLSEVIVDFSENGKGNMIINLHFNSKENNNL